MEGHTGAFSGLHLRPHRTSASSKVKVILWRTHDPVQGSRFVLNCPQTSNRPCCRTAFGDDIPAQPGDPGCFLDLSHEHTRIIATAEPLQIPSKSREVYNCERSRKTTFHQFFILPHLRVRRPLNRKHPPTYRLRSLGCASKLASRCVLLFRALIGLFCAAS
jgi:hypothetical protein